MFGIEIPVNFPLYFNLNILHIYERFSCELWISLMSVFGSRRVNQLNINPLTAGLSRLLLGWHVEGSQTSSSDSLFLSLWPHQSLITLSLHQTLIQRSTFRPEGAGPHFQTPVLVTTSRGGLLRRRHRSCPLRSLRRRNTSTYPCCWRKQASAPLTTPLTKVTDQILELLAPAVEPDKTSLFAFYKAVASGLCFSSTIPTSLAAGSSVELPFLVKE